MKAHLFTMAGAAFVMLANTAYAQYPIKPVRVIVPFSAGSGTDVITRILAQPLQQSMGKTFVIDNRPGADGALAGEMAARAPADGYTLIMATNSPLSAIPHLRKKPPYDALKDFAPISMVGRYTFLVAVNANVSAKSLRELFDHARASPGKLNYASGNTSSIVMTAMLTSLAGVKMVHVPYKSEPPAVVDLISGQVQVMVTSYTTVASHLREGRIRALALALSQRSPLLPTVPTMTEAGLSDYKFIGWWGLAAPRGTPAAAIERLNAEFVKLFSEPQFVEFLNKQAVRAAPTSAQGFADFVREDRQTGAALIKMAQTPREDFKAP